MFVRLSEQESWRLLNEGSVGRLACIADGDPYITPINYYLEEGFAYSHSLPGLKILALRENGRACLQYDEIESDLSWRSVIAFGNYEELTEPNERKRILGKILSRFPLLTPVESALAADGGPPPIIVFRIRIDRITGVAEG